MRRWLCLVVILLLQWPAFAQAPDAVENYNKAKAAFMANQLVQAQAYAEHAIQGASASNRPVIAELLGGIYLEQGKSKQAEPLLKEALAYHKQTKSSTDFAISNLLGTLANLYMRQKNYREAAPYLEERLPLIEATLGPQHIETGVVLTNLGTSYLFTGRKDLAAQYYRRALPILRAHNDSLVTTVEQNLEILGTKDTYVTMQGTGIEETEKGELAFSQGRKEDAIRYLTAALEGSKRYLGPDHYNVQFIQKKLAEVYRIDTSSNYLKDLSKKITRWHDSTKEIIVHITPPGSIPNWNPEYMDLVKSAFSAWQTALDNRIRIVYSDSPKDVDIYVRWFAKAPKAEEGFATVGENLKETTSQYISQNDIHVYLDHGVDKADFKQRLHSMLIHEVGHLMGIVGHSTNPSDIMFDYVDDAWTPSTKLSNRDVTTIKAIYSLKADCTNPPGVHLSNFERFERQMKKAQQEKQRDLLLVPMQGLDFEY